MKTNIGMLLNLYVIINFFAGIVRENKGVW